MSLMSGRRLVKRRQGEDEDDLSNSSRTNSVAVIFKKAASRNDEGIRRGAVIAVS